MASSGTDHGIAAVLRRIAIAGPSMDTIARLRGGVISAIVAGHHKVLCIAPDASIEGVSRLRNNGASTHVYATNMPGMALFAARKVVASLAADLKEYQPHALLVFGPVTETVIKAARKAGVPRIVALLNEWPKGVLAEEVAKELRVAHAIVVHNHDHERALGRSGLLEKGQTLLRVSGSGVDLNHHNVQPLPASNESLHFLMLARLSAEKGVLDFCEAARQVKVLKPSAKFTLAGPDGQLTQAKLQPYSDVVDVRDSVDDIRPLLAGCHVYVYPSHHEGMPPSVLEAMAAGRAIVTTDTSGCRETVDERVNGCLVPPGNPDKLASALLSFFGDPGLVCSAGRASRTKAERQFNQRDVNAQLLQVLGL